MRGKGFKLQVKGWLGAIVLGLVCCAQVQAQGVDFLNWRSNPKCVKWVDSVYNQLTVEERIGQFFMLPAYTSGKDYNMDTVLGLIKRGKAGGVIFFKGMPEAQAIWTNRLQDSAKVGAFIAIDGEWGLAMRLDSTITFPRQMTLGAVGDNKLIYDMGREIGRECKRIGININFAPDVDVNNNANNPVINERSFGEDKYRVALKGLEYAQGMQDEGVLACAKHFPGHGDTDKDSHKELPVVDALDRDPQAGERAAPLLAKYGSRLRFHAENFRDLDRVQGRFAGVLMDIGVSSPQIDQPERGFSFRFDAPLDMRMDTTQGESAADFLAHASVDELTEVIRTYGEERFAWPIAKALVARRDEGQPVRTTGELSAVVARTVKTREVGQDPATRTFQALRIHVNRELGELEDALDAALNMLAPGGRLAVISFHSLEDRIVKTFIARHSRDEVDRRAPFAAPKPLMLQAVARIKPSADEVAANPRSRSAVLRVAERTEVPYTPPASGRGAAPARGRRAR